MAGPQPQGIRVTNFEVSRKFAQSLDVADELRRFRDYFNYPVDKDGRRNIYLCGNSLGLQSKLAVQYIEEELKKWADICVDGHFTGRRPWMQYHRESTRGLAYLTGANENEVVAMNSLTVNLHLMMTTFYRPDAERHKVIIESTAFPSDRFAVMSQIRLHGFDPAEALLEWEPRDDDELHMDDLEALLDEHRENTALLLLPGVQYYNGQVLDMAALCKLAEATGCAIGLDLAHAIGNVPLALHDWAPDFAIWCTYKYLNTGPGSVGGAFVHSRHLDSADKKQLHGWWSNEEATRFKMAPTFVPAKGVDTWQLSCPAVLSQAPLLASLEIFEEAGIDKLRAKSVELTGYLDFLLQQGFSGRIKSITPETSRGCQLSLVVCDDSVDPKSVFRKLEALNITVDWREPDVIRVAPVPLYNGFEDVYEFTERLRIALESN
jgi:kynureninase